jgi:hypothetical protein
MKPKYIYSAIVIAVTVLLTFWQVSTPARAADAELIGIVSTTIKADGSGTITWDINGPYIEQLMRIKVSNVCEDRLLNYFTSCKIEKRSGVDWIITTGTFSDLDRLTQKYYNTLFGYQIQQLEIHNKVLYYDLNTAYIPDSELSQQKIEWKVVAPGKIVNHNADKVSGCTLSWTLGSVSGQYIYLESKTNESCGSGLLSGNNTWLWVGLGAFCCCLLLVVIIVVVVFFVVKRKPKQPVS